MKDDNTPTTSKRSRTPSRKLRLRLDTVKKLKTLNQRSKTVRQREKETKANAKEADPEKHVSVSRVPRVKKNKLAEPSKATTKYKRRQVNKTWLPTHLWHTKRAHMTKTTEPLWRMAIPLGPTEKSYRPTHRASSARGCVAWDRSYMSTVGCLGTDRTLENMLSLLGYAQGLSLGLSKKWKAGTRRGHGWIHEVNGTKQVITQATVVWMVKGAEEQNAVPDEQLTAEGDIEMSDADVTKEKQKRKLKLDRRLFIRVHPSAFHQFWIELLRAAKMQKPQVLVEDLRFEIGSIHIAGPGSTEALMAVLKPRLLDQADSTQRIWSSLAGLNNVSSLPANSMLNLEIVDPRLAHPPGQIRVSQDLDSINNLNTLIATWPADAALPASNLFSHKHRWRAGASMPTQKAINRRKSTVGMDQPIAVIEADPSIPVILLVHRSPNKNSSFQGSWTVLLPWPCVDAVWRSLMYYPLSSGGTPRFGGLEQTQQIAFEQMTPWFPGDFPGTEAGKAWERSEAEKCFDQWIRRPPSRRIRWDLLDLGLGRKGELGRGWSCDWDWMFSDIKRQKEVTEGANHLSQAALSREARKKSRVTFGVNVRKLRKEAKEKAQEEQSRRRNTSSPESGDDEGTADDVEHCPDYTQLTQAQANAMLKSPKSASLPATPAIATVRIRLLTKGTPTAAARIYRLPPPTTPSPTTPKQGFTADESSIAFTTQPPKTQPTSTTTTSTSPSPSTPSLSLRQKWLSLLPSTFHHTSSTRTHTPKQRLNHHSLPPHPHHLPPDPPTHINILPKNAPQQIIDDFGPPVLSPTAATALRERSEREELMAELMKFDMAPDRQWDYRKGLVECPDEADLVGFVCSGGYNLGEGAGTGVGAVWVQKVVQGWVAEEEEEQRVRGGENWEVEVDVEEEQGVVGETGGSKSNGNIKSGQEVDGKDNEKPKLLASQARKIEKERKRREKEKYLCVVRNAGEAVGRLGVWEVCE